MYKHIMLPVDDSELSEKAVDQALRYASATRARVTVLHVVRHAHIPLDMNDDGLRPRTVDALAHRHDAESVKAAEKLLAGVCRLAEERGVDCEPVVVLGREPYEEIVGSASSRNCDLIVMASRRRGAVEGLLLGSETVRVLSHSRLPVLVLG